MSGTAELDERWIAYHDVLQLFDADPSPARHAIVEFAKTRWQQSYVLAMGGQGPDENQPEGPGLTVIQGGRP